MWSSLLPPRAVRLSDNAADQIFEMIVTEELVPGDKLPGERELAAQLAVSRTAVRDSLRILEGKGLLAVQPGRGTYVVENANGMTWIPQWASWLAQHKNQLLQIMEVRRSLEVLGARLAAERATPEDLAAMEAALDRMEESARRDDMAGVVEGHHTFEDLLAQASKNELIALLHQMLYQTLQGRTRTLLRIRGVTNLADEIALHRGILKAVRGRDPEAAAAAMDNQMSRTTELLLKVSETQGAQPTC